MVYEAREIQFVLFKNACQKVLLLGQVFENPLTGLGSGGVVAFPKRNVFVKRICFYCSRGLNPQ